MSEPIQFDHPAFDVPEPRRRPVMNRAEDASSSLMTSNESGDHTELDVDPFDAPEPRALRREPVNAQTSTEADLLDVIDLDVGIEDLDDGSLSEAELNALRNNRRELFALMNQDARGLQQFTLDLGHGRRFHIEELIGSGSFGAAFTAIDSEGKRVVVKLTKPFDRRDMFFNDTEPTPDEAATASAIRSNFNEAAALKQLTKLGEHNPGPRLLSAQHIPNPDDPDTRMVATVMEYIEGQDLRRFIKIHKPKAVIQALIELTKAIRTVHRSKIVHGDVKPGNIIVQEQDGAITVKLIDYGTAIIGDLVARQLEDAEGNFKYDAKRKPVGEPQSPVYAVMPVNVASPDFRIPTEPTTVRVDRYALGRVMQYYLYGDAYKTPRVMETRRTTLLPPLKELDAIATNLVNADPEKRSNINAVLSQLRDLLGKYDEFNAVAKGLES